MKPQLVSILGPLFELVKGDASRIILLKNNTIVLLKDNEDYHDKLKTFSSLNTSKLDNAAINLTLHFFKSYNTLIFIHPGMNDVGLLYTINKNDSINIPSIRKTVFENFKKDLVNSEILFDSNVESLTDYQPIMYLFVNNDLKMGKGKLCAQVGHAVGVLVEELVKVNPPDQCFTDWKEAHMKKIVLKATEEQMNELSADAQELESFNGQANCVKIHDAGLTQIPSNSFTVLGFKPMYKKDVPEKFASFSLL